MAFTLNISRNQNDAIPGYSKSSIRVKKEKVKQMTVNHKLEK